MRRIGRWMLNALTVLSLLLCVGTCVLWVRSYWRYDVIVWAASNAPKTQYSPQNDGSGTLQYYWFVLDMRGGRFEGKSDWELYTQHADLPPPALVDYECRITHRATPFGPFLRGVLDPTTHYDDRLAGFELIYPIKRINDPTGFDGIGHRRRLFALIVPMWAVAGLLAPLPAFRFYRWRRRSPAGHCSSCGYNLRDNLSGVCPECGRKIAEAK